MAGKALYEMGLSGDVQTTIMSMHDASEDAEENKYFPAEIFRGSSAKKLSFIRDATIEGRRANSILLSHINLLLVGWLIKKVAPKTTIFLFAHGIEVWGDLSYRRRQMLNACDGILCVSNYTKNIIVKKHQFPAQKCSVLNNCIDPFLPLPGNTKKTSELMTKYGFSKENLVLFTLTRLSSKDRYKGYDKVFEALAKMRAEYPHVRYLVGGGYDPVEKQFVDDQIHRLNIEDIVTIAGYLPDEELADYFAMADIYIMPSKKEGFGIVFVEAMFYGLPVIAGNADGSTDALLNGKLGLLVNPESVEEIKKAIEKMIRNIAEFKPDHKLLMHSFSYATYKKNLEQIISKP